VARSANREKGRGLVGNGRKRRKMSAAARKRISEAQKARWAKQKAAATSGATKGSRKETRK
jgi:hypothetical protein